MMFWLVFVETLVTLLGFLAAVGLIALLVWAGSWFVHRVILGKRSIRLLVPRHIAPYRLTDLLVSKRTFPYRVRADLSRALEHVVTDRRQLVHFCAVGGGMSERDKSLANMISGGFWWQNSQSPEYEDLDIGEDKPLAVLTSGFWLVRDAKTPLIVLMGRSDSRTRWDQALEIHVAAPNTPECQAAAVEFFTSLEKRVQQGRSYRGKILSLECDETQYSGEGVGIQVHRLPPVQRDQVILPAKTLDLLDRNIISFVKQRPRLAALGQATKKGLLFYGPPGTGKTFTIHYLMTALPDHTTLLVTAEQVAFLGETMKLARFLQPSIVVIEDADLIGRDRQAIYGAHEETLLNKLLNEMDGLVATTDVLFILTTNRPESLEAALASRPGRIDQAIEFPLPDEACRRKLVALYAGSAQVGDELAAEIVARTVGVSAAFIKELMRRAIQFQLERDGDGPLVQADIDAALDELLVRGGSLNRALLGAATVDRDA